MKNHGRGFGRLDGWRRRKGTNLVATRPACGGVARVAVTAWGESWTFCCAVSTRRPAGKTGRLRRGTGREKAGRGQQRPPEEKMIDREKIRSYTRPNL